MMTCFLRFKAPYVRAKQRGRNQLISSSQSHLKTLTMRTTEHRSHQASPLRNQRVCRSNTACLRISTEGTTQDRLICSAPPTREVVTQRTSDNPMFSRECQFRRNQVTVCSLRLSASLDMEDKKTPHVRSREKITALLEVQNHPIKCTTMDKGQATNANIKEATQVLSRVLLSQGMHSRAQHASLGTSPETRATNTDILHPILVATLGKLPHLNREELPMGLE